MKNEGELLKKAIRRLDITQDEAARRLGMSRQNLRFYLTSAVLNDKFKQSLKDKLEIDLSLTSEEARKGDNEPHQPVPQTDFMEVPVLTIFGYAGYLRGLSEDSSDVKFDKMLIPREYDKGNYLVIEVKGDSMDDNTRRGIVEGDKILAKELSKEFWKTKLHIRNNIWVLVTTNGIAIKQIVEHDVEKGVITCHSWNDLYEDYKVKLKEVYQLFYIKKIVERNVKP